MRTDPAQADLEPPAAESLAGLLQRMPRVQPVPPVPAASALARWRGTWSRRHTVATVTLAPLLYAAYRGAVGAAGEGSILWAPFLVLLATSAAATLATYLPPRAGARSTTGPSPCATVAGVHVLLAGLVLGTVAAPANGALALGLVAFAMAQRLGRASCGLGAA